jgi:GNAT superfamily N-acetyltransferase
LLYFAAVLVLGLAGRPPDGLGLGHDVEMTGFSGFAVQEAVEPERLPQLMELFGSAWWMAERTVDDVAQMLRESDLVLALVQGPTDRLVGFARVLTDYTYLAMVLDVIVSEDFRGAGLGAALMDAVVQHPRLAGVRSVELVCQPDLVSFYRRWGFTDMVGQSRLMRRTSDSLLTSEIV